MPPERLRLLALVYLWRVLFPVLFLFALPSALVRLLRRGNYREKFAERFGYFDRDTAGRLEANGPWTWMHAVSVGEMLMALRLAEEWKKREPDLRLVLSVTTTTGFAQARPRLQPWMELIYHPIDFPGAVKRTLQLLRPDRVVFVEAAVWPNLLFEARRCGAACAIVNARMSPRSERRYRKFGWLARPLFGLLDLVCVQEAAHREVWRGLGVAGNRVVRTGSIKFDVRAPDPLEVAERRRFLDGVGLAGRSPILLGGSTWPGEETALARVLISLRNQRPGMLLVVVPRHVERTAAITGELKEFGLRVALRSGGGQVADADAVIVNTTGELRYWYPLGDVIFVGKSLFEEGGQNPVEAVITGRPVLCGPHMENFRDVAPQLERSGLLRRVGQPGDLERAIIEALDQPPRPATGGVLDEHAGATGRTVEALRSLDLVHASATVCRANRQSAS